MKQFYLAPIALVHNDTTRPGAHFEWSSTPDNPDTALVVVYEWRSAEAQDAWEALADVDELPVFTWHLPAPPRLHRGFAAHGARPAQSIAEAMRAIRLHWPAARL